jgi:broad specificity phosphatase PhoE
MTEVVRLTLVSHAMTDAMSAGRFALDEPLSRLGRRQLESGSGPDDFEYALCGPELRTRETAELAGLPAEPEPALADLDVGRWSGVELAAVDPHDLDCWLTDPTAAPHGGESIVDLVVRVRAWLSRWVERPARICAITHPAVIRAAVVVVLDAPPASFWRIDVAPLSRTVLHHRTAGWTLRR